VELTRLQALTGRIAPSRASQSSLSRWITAVWLFGTLVLLPVDLIGLPFNMSLVDVWILVALPFFWLSFVRGHQAISLAYAAAMWLVLVASIASTFAAPNPSGTFL
jgi:hypothetical protein